MTGTQNLIFGYLESAKKWAKGELNKAFWQIFDDYTKFHNTFSAFHFKKASNMAKKMKKSSVWLAYNPFLHGIAGVPKTQGFQVPILSLKIPIFYNKIWCWLKLNSDKMRKPNSENIFFETEVWFNFWVIANF